MSSKIVIEDKTRLGGKVSWRLVAGNGRTIAKSPKKYTQVADAKRAIKSVKDVIQEAEIDVREA